MGYENFVVAVDKRRRRTSTDSDSVALDALKIGGSSGQEINSSNVIVTDNSAVLQNKTIHGASNTIQELPGSSLADSAKQAALEHRKHAVWAIVLNRAVSNGDGSKKRPLCSL